MRPILFNTEMVRAILDGRKTVTRRVVKPQPAGDGSAPEPLITRPGYWNAWGDDFVYRQPYKPGDILYVRETWFYEEHMHDSTDSEPDLPSGRYSHRYIFKADSPDYPVNVGVCANGWRPSIHMPKDAARIFLRVTDVRVERLQEITEDQAREEGCCTFADVVEHKENAMYPFDLTARDVFSELWDSTIKPADLARYSWETNPWVWVIEFERISKEEAQQNER